MNKKRISIITLIVGLIALVAGAVFLIVRLNSGAGVADGEYLVSIGEWTIEGDNCVQSKCGESAKCVDADGRSTVICESNGVIWNFTDIGKGTLTTNNHINDYDFTWAIEDDKLEIQTEWLYTLNNAYEYSLDQDSNTLTLKDGDKTIKFVPAK